VASGKTVGQRCLPFRRSDVRVRRLRASLWHGERSRHIGRPSRRRRAVLRSFATRSSAVSPLALGLPRPGRRKARERVLRSAPLPHAPRQRGLTTGLLTGRDEGRLVPRSLLRQSSALADSDGRAGRATTSAFAMSGGTGQQRAQAGPAADVVAHALDRNGPPAEHETAIMVFQSPLTRRSTPPHSALRDWTDHVVGTLPSEAVEDTSGPFMNQIAVLPLASRQSRSLFRSPS
jgi:hypothetical protein